MIIRFKRIDKRAVMPLKKNNDDVGYDITCIGYVVDNIDLKVNYSTGLAIEIPEGYGGFLFPRSSIRTTDLSLTNCVGIIDPGYTGEVKATYRLHASELKGFPDIYKPGDRMLQLVVMKVESLQFEEVQDLNITQRGSGGFGSTGK